MSEITRKHRETATEIWKQLQHWAPGAEEHVISTILSKSFPASDTAGWISMRKRKPPIGICLFHAPTADENSPFIATTFYDGKQWLGLARWHKEITHWMPLPPAPSAPVEKD